jgi:hypothetical protein
MDAFEGDDYLFGYVPKTSKILQRQHERRSHNNYQIMLSLPFVRSAASHGDNMEITPGIPTSASLLKQAIGCLKRCGQKRKVVKIYDARDRL